MHVCFIYHPQERYLAEPISEKLEAHGVECRLAPIGMPLMSAEWKSQACYDISTSFCTIALITEASQKDGSVAFRLDQAKTSQTAFVPLLRVDGKYRADKLLVGGERNFQAIQYFTEEEAIRRLFRMLPQLQTMTFLSYSRKDETIAARVRQHLEADGYRVWQDTLGIKGGVLWDDEVERALRSCTHIAWLVSQNSLASQNVRDEIGYAINNGKPIIPIIIDETTDTDLPLRAHRYQVVRIRRDFNKAIGEIKNSIQRGSPAALNGKEEFAVRQHDIHSERGERTTISLTAKPQLRWWQRLFGK